MHCTSCGYELVGLPPGSCPECAHPFDPDDPGTWVPRPVPPWRKALSSRWLGYVAVTSIGFCAMWLTILPRPFVSWDGRIDPLLWIWFDRPFGLERQRAMPEQLELSWWNGTLTGVSLRRADPADPAPHLELAWHVRRRGDQWTLDVLQRDVRFGSILLAYNSMRRDSELFGLQLEDPDQDPEARPSRIDATNDEPFSARGRQEDVLAAILVAYDLSVRPVLITHEDTDLWVFDREQGRLERIGVDQAEARGIDYAVVESLGVRRHRFRY